jgi:hypothetical protein
MDIVFRPTLLLTDDLDDLADLVSRVHADRLLIDELIVELCQVLQSLGQEVITEELAVLALTEDGHLLTLEVPLNDARL